MTYAYAILLLKHIWVIIIKCRYWNIPFNKYCILNINNNTLKTINDKLNRHYSLQVLYLSLTTLLKSAVTYVSCRRVNLMFSNLKIKTANWNPGLQARIFFLSFYARHNGRINLWLTLPQIGRFQENKNKVAG